MLSFSASWFNAFYICIFNLWQHEIIEFPACLVHIESRKIVGEFHSYVRPFRKAHLSDFCMELTGITQEKVDQAPYFPQVFKQFVGWLRSYGLLDQTSDGRVKISKHTPSWTLLTDSPADICKVRWSGPTNKFYLNIFNPCGKSKLIFFIWKHIFWLEASLCAFRNRSYELRTYFSSSPSNVRWTTLRFLTTGRAAIAI